MVKVVYDHLLYQQGVIFERSIPLDSSQPHHLTIGASGSGKTFCSIWLLAKSCYECYRQNKPIYMIVADYKAGEDFDFLSGLSHFYRFDGVEKALDLALTVLKCRQKGLDKSKTKFILFIDEWGSYLASLSSKESKEALKKLSRLAMLGRSFNIQLVIANQRGDSEYFLKVRDNFSSILALGTLSKETVNMFWSDEKELIQLKNARGTGYLKVAGKATVKVVVPSLSSEQLDFCQDIIRYIVEQSSSYFDKVLAYSDSEATLGEQSKSE